MSDPEFYLTVMTVAYLWFVVIHHFELFSNREDW